MAYDPNTYLPGDAWETTEFISRALTAPRLFVAAAAAPIGGAAPVAGVNMTKPSYFEYRQGKGDSQQVELSVQGSGAFEVSLQRSFDGGDTWQTVITYDENVEEYYRYGFAAMLRLLVEFGTGISIGLRQQLQ